MNQHDTSIERRLGVLRTLQAPSGLFMASAQDVTTGYNKAWLRDNFYTSLAFEVTGDWDTVHRMWRAILDIFLKHEDKIDWAAQNKPHESWQYIHARYNPETFDEYWEEWGNKQNDAVGAILFKLGELEAAGHGIVQNEADRRITQRLIDYLASIEYWHDPDNGVWEENEEVHMSSVGACLAGLKSVARLPYINVPDELIQKGEDALRTYLPRESVTKYTDLALLSLIYPYNVVDKEMAHTIVRNVEYYLERDMGVIRYRNDAYYNANADGISQEAEWTFGFPWLAAIYAQMGNFEKAMEYYSKALGTINEQGEIPELYYSNSAVHNENTPLGWSESLFVVAAKEIEKS
jgi:phosphorylase kinase alpha/beta subunit